MIALFRRIAKSTGATIVSTLADLDGNESFDASSLGTADEVMVPYKSMKLIQISLIYPASLF